MSGHCPLRSPGSAPQVFVVCKTVKVKIHKHLLFPLLSHLVSSIFLILARDLLLVKARAARAVARMMMSAPTITLEPALTTELREAAAACFSRSLEAEIVES